MSSMSDATTEESIESDNNPIACGTIDREELDIVGRLLGSTIDEAKLSINAGGMHIRCCDAANVAMFGLHYEPTEWTCAREGTIGVDIASGLTDPLKRCKKLKHDSVELSITDDRKFQYQTADNETIEIAAIDPDSVRQRPELPDIPVSEECVMSLEELTQWLNAISSYSQVILTTSNAGLSIDVIGETTSMGKTFPYDALADVSFTGEGVADHPGDNMPDSSIDFHAGEEIHAQSQYSVEYLYDMTNALLKAQTRRFDVRLQFGTEFPLIVELLSDDSAIRGRYFLAPRTN